MSKIIVIEGIKEQTSLQHKKPVPTQMYVTIRENKDVQFTLGTLHIQINKENLNKLINELNQLL